MKVTAVTVRSGDWWAIEVPEISGLFTQAKRLDQVAEAVTDAAATLGVHEDLDISREVSLPDDDLALVAAVRKCREELRAAETEAFAASRNAVGRLRAGGLPVRDVATLLEVSPQRVSQMESDMRSRARA